MKRLIPRTWKKLSTSLVAFMAMSWGGLDAMAAPPSKAGPSFETQARGRNRERDERATERSIKDSIRNQEQILELEDKSALTYPRQAMALADFYWDLAEFYGNRVNSEEIERPLFEAQQKGNAKDIEKWQREQARLADLKRKYQDETIKRYRDITRRFPKADNIDEIRYFLAYNLTEMGRGEEGIEEYMRIITEHPSSPYVPDALVNIGDYYFELNDFGNAYKLYEKAGNDYSTNHIHGYAVYKQAWCLYNLGEHKASLDRFIQVINLADQQAKDGKTGAIALRREAQNELVLPYSKSGKPSEAIKFIRDTAKASDRYLTIAGRLAELYTEQNEYQKSTELLRLLMDEARKNAIDGKSQAYMVVQFQRQIVNNAMLPGDKNATVQEIGNLMRLYEGEVLNAPAEFLETEKGEAKRLILETAHAYHTEYTKTKELKTLEYTQRLYDEYLRVFRKDENAYEISWNNALLMVTTEKFEEAASEFEAVIAMDPNGPYADPASERVVLAYLKLIQLKKNNNLKSQTQDDLKPLEIPIEEKRFVEAIDRWMALIARKGENPETKDNVSVARFAAARTMYDYNHFSDAGARFAEFLEKHPGHEFENDARRYILSSYNLGTDIDNLRKYAQAFEKVAGLPQDLHEDILKIKNAFNFQECQKLSGNKEHLKAATCFEQYAQDFPKEDKAPEAVYNAAISYFEARQVDKALKTQLALYEKYKTSNELAPKALYAIAEMYRQTTVYDQAASFYEYFVNNHPNHPLAERALRYASIFRKTLGHYQPAIKNLQTYLKKYPNESNAPRVDFDIILIYEKLEDWKRMEGAITAHLRRYTKESPSLRLQVLNKLGIAYSKQRKSREARQAHEETLKAFTALEDRFKRDLDLPGISAVAESHFQMGEIELQRARAIKLEGRTDKAIKGAVGQKLEIMNRVKETYERVIAYGHPGWVIAAAAQLGTAYQDLADSIENAPMPVSLRNFPEAEDEYRQLMAEQSGRIREQALVNHRLALSTAREHRWFNDYSEKAEGAIAQLDLEDKSVKEFRLRPVQVTPNGGLPQFARGE